MIQESWATKLRSLCAWFAPLEMGLGLVQVYLKVNQRANSRVQPHIYIASRINLWWNGIIQTKFSGFWDNLSLNFRVDTQDFEQFRPNSSVPFENRFFPYHEKVWVQLGLSLPIPPPPTQPDENPNQSWVLLGSVRPVSCKPKPELNRGPVQIGVKSGQVRFWLCI